MRKILPLSIVVLATLVACTTLYTTTVTITHTVDTAMKSAALLEAQHQLPAGTWTRIAAAHDQYRKAAAVAQQALISYKAGVGDKPSWEAAFSAVLDMAQPLMNIILPLLAPEQSIVLKTNYAKAAKGKRL